MPWKTRRRKSVPRVEQSRPRRSPCWDPPPPPLQLLILILLQMTCPTNRGAVMMRGNYWSSRNVLVWGRVRLSRRPWPWAWRRIVRRMRGRWITSRTAREGTATKMNVRDKPSQQQLMTHPRLKKKLHPPHLQKQQKQQQLPLLPPPPTPNLLMIKY